jgi:hypothetical protein
MTYTPAFDSTSSSAWWLLGYAPVLAAALLMLVVVGFVTWAAWRGGRRFRFFGMGLFLLLAFEFISGRLVLSPAVYQVVSSHGHGSNR